MTVLESTMLMLEEIISHVVCLHYNSTRLSHYQSMYNLIGSGLLHVTLIHEPNQHHYQLVILHGPTFPTDEKRFPLSRDHSIAAGKPLPD